MPVVNIYDAKTQLSRLVKRARAGEEVVIAEAGKPVARLVPIERPREPRVLGADRGSVRIDDDAFAPLTPDELTEWEDAPVFPSPSPTPPTPRRPRRRTPTPKRPQQRTRRR